MSEDDTEQLVASKNRGRLVRRRGGIRAYLTKCADEVVAFMEQEPNSDGKK